MLLTFKTLTVKPFSTPMPSYIKDKDILWQNIRNVGRYNDLNIDDKVYVDMTQLPEKLAKDKESLLNDYLKAKKDEKSPKWKYDRSRGQYCYVIGGKFFRPKQDFFKKNSENS